MTYNLEQYRDKRGKVLGVQRRALSFGRASAFFATGILLLVGIVVVPQMVTFLYQRNLDDVIYRLKDNNSMSSALLESIKEIPGVVKVIKDEKKQRLILTFNRTQTKPEGITGMLKQQKIDVIQLNVIDHRQHLATLKKEAVFEAL